MSVLDEQRAEFARTPQIIATLGVRYCANWYAGGRAGNGEQGVARTEDFNHFLWSKTNCTVTSDTHEAPDGTMTADTLDFTAATGHALRTCDFALTNAAGDSFTGSVWLKTDSGSGTITIRVDRLAGTDLADQLVTVTTEWQRFRVDLVQTVNGSVMRFHVRREAGDLAQVIAWGANCSKIVVGYPAPATGHLFPYIKRVDESVQLDAVQANRCQATDAGDGARCYYSFATCQDRANFNCGNTYEATPGLRGIREYRFCLANGPLPLAGEEIYPYLTGADWAGQEIDPEKAITVPERVSLRMEEDEGAPGLWDAGKSTEGALVNTELDAGSFWRRWLAVFKGSYSNPECYAKVKRGFVASGMTEALYEQRGNFLIRNVTISTDGRVTIQCANRLAMLRKKGPAKISSDNLLTEAIDASQTTFELDDVTEITEPPVDGSYQVVILIDSEKMNVTGYDEATNIVTVQRGRWGTTAATHARQTAFSEVMEFGTERSTPALTPLGINFIDAVVQILRRSGILEADIDTATFTTIRDTWFPSTVDTATGATTGTLCRRTVTDQTDFEKLLTEIREVLMLDIFVNEEQLVTGHLFAPALPTETLPTLTDEENFIKDSVAVDDNDESRLTRVVVAYDLVGGEKGDDIADYNDGVSWVEPELESRAGGGEQRWRIILSKWIQANDAATASRAAAHIQGRHRMGIRKLSASVELKDDGVRCGQFALVTTYKLQKPDGSTDADRQMLVVKKEPQDDWTIALSLVDAVLPGRPGFIAPAGHPDYDAATADERRYCFIGSVESNQVGTPPEAGYTIF